MYAGRVDDVLVLSNGLKVNPLDVEGVLLVHPVLRVAVVFGSWYAKCGLLLEAKE